MKKNWTKIAIALGPLIIIASLVWEYARVNPSVNFIIEPWAITGWETDHGIVFLTLGIMLLVGGLATAWEGMLNPAYSAAVTAYFVIAATVFTFLFTDETITVSVTTVNNVILSFVVASAVALALRSLLGGRISLFKRALPVAVAVFVAFATLIGVSFSGSDVELQAWVAVFVVFLLAAGLSVSIKPLNIAANRMLIFTSVAAWTVILLSAGALRETLIRLQNATVQANGVSGASVAYKDTQAALGWWLAGFGITVLFVGAVGLWARRRDIVAALARARKQRAAAEISAREIAEAAEAYAKELEARGASSS